MSPLLGVSYDHYTILALFDFTQDKFDDSLLINNKTFAYNLCFLSYFLKILEHVYKKSFSNLLPKTTAQNEKNSL